MNYFSNPFGFIHEKSNSLYSPHTRTLRSSFLDKLKDTFYVLIGSFKHISRKDVQQPHYRLGLLDYLPFMGLSLIPFALVKLAQVAERKDYEKLANVVGISAFALFWFFTVLKVAIALICMIPATLIVAGTHLVARIIAGKAVSEAESIVLTDPKAPTVSFSLAKLINKTGYMPLNDAFNAAVIDDNIQLTSGYQTYNSKSTSKQQVEAFAQLNYFGGSVIR